MNSKMSILIFFSRSVMQPKKERKKRKINWTILALGYNFKLTQQFFPLCLLCMLHQFLDSEKKSLDFCSDILILLWNINTSIPSIAQLVERRTVVIKMSSLGRWFKSGSKEFLLFVKENC